MLTDNQSIYLIVIIYEDIYIMNCMTFVSEVCSCKYLAMLDKLLVDHCDDIR